MLSPVTQFIARKALSILLKNSTMLLCSALIRAAIFFVEVFPILSQIILGGKPFKLERSIKSASKVTILKLFDLAYSQIWIS